MSTQSDSSNRIYARRISGLTPTVPMMPRHFYPAGYPGDYYLFPDLGRPAPDGARAPYRSPYAWMALAIGLVLWLVVVGLIVRSSAQPAADLTQEPVPAASKTLGRPAALPEPSAAAANTTLKPKGPLDGGPVFVACELGPGAHTCCLGVPSASYGGTPGGPAISCFCPFPTESQSGSFFGTFVLSSIRAAQKQRFLCDQWFGLDVI